jgi:hypothetical protein
VVKIVIKYGREHIENNDRQNEMGKTRGKVEMITLRDYHPRINVCEHCGCNV